MGLLSFKYDDSRYYLNDSEIDETKAKNMLNSTQLKLLLKNGFIRIRSKNEVTKEPVKKIKLSADDKLFEKSKADYRVDHTKYKDGIRIELWRKNKKYGYYNFAAYLNSDSDIEFKEAVIKDVKEQNKIAQEKKQKKATIFDFSDNDLI